MKRLLKSTATIALSALLVAALVIGYLEARKKPGQAVKLEVLREGKPVTLEVALGERPAT